MDSNSGFTTHLSKVLMPLGFSFFTPTKEVDIMILWFLPSYNNLS